MPKKISTNPKAEAARERKEEVKKAKKSAEEKAKEDAKWVDEGSTAAEKRRQEKAKKDAEEAKKRAEKKAIAEKEAAEIAALSGKAKGVSNSEKITRAQLLRQQEEELERRKLEAEREKLEKLKIVAPEPVIQPNLNRQASTELAKDVEQYGAGNVIHASGAIDASLSQLGGGALSSSTSSSTTAIDKHPEKRMKSAYEAYEERQMPIVRAENPKLKLSQYKQIIFKDWQKSPENPFNIRKAREASLLEQTDAYKYGNFRE